MVSVSLEIRRLREQELYKQPMGPSWPPSKGSNDQSKKWGEQEGGAQDFSGRPWRESLNILESPVQAGTPWCLVCSRGWDPKKDISGKTSDIWLNPGVKCRTIYWYWSLSCDKYTVIEQNFNTGRNREHRMWEVSAPTLHISCKSKTIQAFKSLFKKNKTKL